MARTSTDELLDEAESLIESAEGDRDTLNDALAVLDRARAGAQAPEERFDAWFLTGVAWSDLGDLGAALRAFEEALTHAPDSVEARQERALTLFEMRRYEEASKALEALIADNADDAWGHYYLGLIAERTGKADKAQALLQKAHALLPDEVPGPAKLSDAEFAQAVDEALRALPDYARKHLETTPVTIEAIPDEDDLTQGDHSPTIVGLFRGQGVTERSMLDGQVSQMPSIVLFQRNLERSTRSAEELHEQIRVTVLHEVGHLLGLDEDELYARGLD